MVALVCHWVRSGIIGASLSEPHIVVLSRMSVRPVGVCPTSGVCLAYDRISKWKIALRCQVSYTGVQIRYTNGIRLVLLSIFIADCMLT